MKFAAWLTGTACAVGFSIALVAQHADPLAAIGAPAQPAPPSPKAVTETFFGQQVTDKYRYMEAMDADTTTWMKTQGAYTRSVLDAIAPRGGLAERVASFTGSFGLIQSYATYGGRMFYEERAPGA